MNVLQNNDFSKIIVKRNILERFLSGFYEDLRNNCCYCFIDITFYEYCLFLKHCFDNKLKCVKNLNVFFTNVDMPIWWGSSSDTSTNPITDDEGNISGHIISQTKCIKNLVSQIRGKNVKIIEQHEIHLNLHSENKEIKNKNMYITSNENVDSMLSPNIKLSVLKKMFLHNENLPTIKELYNTEIIEIINHIYKDDYVYFNYLDEHYKV